MFYTYSSRSFLVLLAVPLKCRCSRKCATPLVSCVSFLLPHLMKTEMLDMRIALPSDVRVHCLGCDSDAIVSLGDVCIDEVLLKGRE